MLLLLAACVVRPPTSPPSADAPSAEQSPKSGETTLADATNSSPAASGTDAVPATTEPDGEGFPPLAQSIPWPLWTYQSPPDGAKTPLPGPPDDLDLHPRDGWALVLREGRLFRWDYQGPVQALDLPGLGRVEQAAFSQFDGSLFLIVSENTKFAIERWDVEKRERKSTIYESNFALDDLVVPLLHWSARERLFFSGQGRILSCTRAGKRCYEVTSPDGKPSELTEAALAKPANEWDMPPAIIAATNARPLSIHAATGSLLWQDAKGYHERRWTEGNWGEDRLLPGATMQPAYHPNGWYMLEWLPGKVGIKATPRAGKASGAGSRQWLAFPQVSASGRSLVGYTAEGLVSETLNLPLAPVRHIEGPEAGMEQIANAVVDDPNTPLLLEKYGLAIADGGSPWLHEAYDFDQYSYVMRPVLATVDGMAETMYTGFRAVFIRTEQELAAPRLRAFLEQLSLHADGRTAEAAREAQKLLSGDYSSAEGKRVLGEASTESPVLGRLINFGDFHPRGPYDHSDALRAYFRAFKYTNSIRLSEAERRDLAAKPALVAAWKDWVDTQATYLATSRFLPMFGESRRPDWLRTACLPKETQEDPYRLFPLAWALDSEILERGVAHDSLPPECGVPTRGLPSGLDLLAGLGSAEAWRRLAGERNAYPGLEQAQAQRVALFGQKLAVDSVVSSWMRLIQILGNDELVPEKVDRWEWRSRLMESALASWASYRHTTVLINEATAAEFGGGGPDAFEVLDSEPVRHVVDPLPEAWAQLADLLSRLGAEAQKSPTTDKLAELLNQCAADASKLGGLAERQRRNEPLTELEYDYIRSFAGTIEHPTLAFLAALSNGEYPEPEPMARIVDIHTWNEPGKTPKIWHAAVGKPRRYTVLVGDRGLLIPGRGYTYSFHEVVSSGTVLDDTVWRAQVDRADRPVWTKQAP